MLCCLSIAKYVQAQVDAPRLQLVHANPQQSYCRIESSFQTNVILTLEASTDVREWTTIGVFHDVLLNYPDVDAFSHNQRFYRLRASPRQASDDWKNQIVYPDEPFSTTYNKMWSWDVQAHRDFGWVKFAILLNEPDRVYYQDSKKYPFHYDFAVQRLAPFKGMDPLAFEHVSLYRTNQQVVLGSVLFPWNRNPPTQSPRIIESEYAVQFAGEDAYSPGEIARWFELVKATVHAPQVKQVFYLPTFEQLETTQSHAQEFAARGIPVTSIRRWITVNDCYTEGWALGRLQYFPSSEINTAFADGRLRSEDILLTDGIRVDTPEVAGLITLEPSTPNSHTAIRCATLGIPFVYLWDAAERDRMQGLVGHKVLLRATASAEEVEIKVLDLEESLTPEFESELLELKRPRAIQFAPKEVYGAFSASSDTLVPADIRFFGGKAANYGILRRSIPTNCPIAIAFSFDLWDAFLDQVLSSGKSLRTEIAERLASYTHSPVDISALRASLADIRTLIVRTARFTPAQKQAITNALVVFNPNRKIRFRSSTNVEDSEFFTGAGLYDSYSGCLLDDLDQDDTGPCQCDDGENEERGVFRAMQKVYASFYNDNAYLARLMHGVDETKAAMGILVHHSFPDEDELANGVATLDVNKEMIQGQMVTQLGAESVANPDGRCMPEVINWYNDYPVMLQSSSFLPLGAFVLAPSTRNAHGDYVPGEYDALRSLFKAVGNRFLELYPAKDSIQLDFEFKKDRCLGLVIKQVRIIPKPNQTNQTAYLIDEPASFCIVQDENRLTEQATIFSNHRLKSLWTFRTLNMRLSPASLAQGIYTETTCQYVEDGIVRTLSGPLSSWPNASQSPSGSTCFWTTGTGTNQRNWKLDTTLPASFNSLPTPILTQTDLAKTVTVTYSNSTSVVDVIELQVMPRSDDGVLQERIFQKSNGVSITTMYYWKKPPIGYGLFSSPLLRFVETHIAGLTTTPIALTNYFSQTYKTWHHNMCEEFLFEPRLEPGLTPAALAELQAKDIMQVHAEFWPTGRDYYGAPQSFAYLIGYDGARRELR